MRLDRYFCYATAGLWLVIIVGYLARIASRGVLHAERVTRIGATPLVGRGIMDATYWAIEPVVRGLAAIGATPNHLTWGALVAGLGAGVAAGFGGFGLAVLLGTLSTIGDILDGQLARVTGRGSHRGELLDAAVDRYTEFALLAGMVFALRDSWWQTALALAAMLASFMISYSTAKAEAMHVAAPRGLMRRHERSVYLLVGTGTVPLVGPILVERGVPYVTTIVIALALVAGIGNVAAVVRLVRIGRALR